ncbi:MAG: lipid A biosynthesis acyltransferase [Myxococcales bacterium]|nr:lipid A biosynthesis acyltransferase [Myxococcales bacterium]MCB9531204.1 lipid A biosynthesis acyltransferase [Myxococcales bacterium]
MTERPPAAAGASAVDAPPARDAATSEATAGDGKATAATSEATAGDGKAWLTRRELGTIAGIRAVFTAAKLVGRRATSHLVRAVAAYYTFTRPEVRAASRGWLTTVLEREPTRAEISRHVATFAQCALDRIYLLSGELDRFSVTRDGHHYLAALAAARRGAILLGAHLGSFEAMRAAGTDEDLSIAIVGHFDNARMINALLERIDPGAAARVVHAGRDPVTFGLTVRERIEAGDMVAILADRVGLNEKAVPVQFFGREAWFPSGPFLIAAALHCPVYLVFGVYSPPNRYALSCEPFSERITLPRGQREEALRAVVQDFATRLEQKARANPYNWFNFYDFWSPPAT